jgi:hypothetical protein
MLLVDAALAMIAAAACRVVHVSAGCSVCATFKVMA